MNKISFSKRIRIQFAQFCSVDKLIDELGGERAAIGSEPMDGSKLLSPSLNAVLGTLLATNSHHVGYSTCA